ncbi:hypothetical protein P3S67_007348 [Capsicum chacoense]
MDLEKKLWAASRVLFLFVGMAALGHAAWLVGPVMAIALLGGYFVVSGFLRVLNIGAVPVGSFDGLGLAVSWLFLLPLLSLQKENPHGHVTLFLLMCTASFFCVLMMVRPLNTDFGVLYGLCYLTASLASEEFGTGWQTWLAISLGTLMISLRAIMEMQARGD